MSEPFNFSTAPESEILWQTVRWLESVRADPHMIKAVKHAARVARKLEQSVEQGSVAGQHEARSGF